MAAKWRVRLSAVLCLALILGAVPVAAFAGSPQGICRLADDDPEPDTSDKPITSDIKDHHHKSIGNNYSASDTVECGPCHGNRYPVRVEGCTDEGCHRIAEAFEIGRDDKAPENHGYITDYDCKDCHKIREEGGQVTRPPGKDRIETAIEISRENFPSADAVILATSMDFADALSASALAGSERAPLLLTRKDVLSPGVLDEIERLGADKVYIMGSTAAISANVANSLTSESLEVERIGGYDRYETSALVARKVAFLEGSSFAKKAFLARGDNFADGLSASPVAYINKYPVILTRSALFPTYATDVIQSLGINDVTITGSDAAVSTGVEAIVKGLSTNPTVRRLGGTDRYGTAQKVAAYALDNSLAGKGFIGVATGLNFPDALAGGVATGERGGILVLTTPHVLSPVWVSYLPSTYSGITPDIQLFGGANVLSDDVKHELEDLLL